MRTGSKAIIVNVSQYTEEAYGDNREALSVAAREASGKALDSRSPGSSLSLTAKRALSANDLSSHEEAAKFHHNRMQAYKMSGSDLGADLHKQAKDAHNDAIEAHEWYAAANPKED